MDAELEFAIQPNTTGKQLFDQVREDLLLLSLLLLPIASTFPKMPTFEESLLLLTPPAEVKTKADLSLNEVGKF